MRAARDDYYEYMVADAEMHFELITVFDNDRIKDIYYPICDELVRIDLLLIIANLNISISLPLKSARASPTIINIKTVSVWCRWIVE